MSRWLLVPLLALIAILQITLLSRITVAGFKVDLPLMIVVAWGLTAPFGEAAEWGFIIGLFLDLASGMPFGTQTLALTAIGLGTSFTQIAFSRDNLLATPIVIFFGTIIHHAIILGILSALGTPLAWNDYLLRITLPSAILNTLAMPLAYFPLQRLQQRLHPRLDV